MTLSLNILSCKLIISISLGFFFLGFYFVLSFGTYSSVLSFCLTFSFWFYELGKTSSPGLEGLALCGSVPCVDCLCLVALAGLLELECSGLEAVPRGGTVPEVALVGWLGLDQAQARGNPWGALCPWPLGTVAEAGLGLDWWQSLGSAAPKAFLEGWLGLKLELARLGGNPGETQTVVLSSTSNLREGSSSSVLIWQKF